MKKLMVKLLNNQEERNQFYKLRHQVFTLEKNWVDSIVFEKDEFDRNAYFLGVFFDKELAAASRIITQENPWMFESVFASMLEKPIEKEACSVEATRYFVAEKYRKMQTFGSHKVLVSKVLQQGLFEFCNLNGFTKIYCTLTRKLFFLFRMQGIPAESLNGEIRLEGDMEATLAALIYVPKVQLTSLLNKKLLNIVDISFHQN